MSDKFSSEVRTATDKVLCSNQEQNGEETPNRVHQGFEVERNVFEL